MALWYYIEYICIYLYIFCFVLTRSQGITKELFMKRFAIVLLAVMLVVPLMFSCGDKDQAPVSESKEESETSEKVYKTPVKDMKDRSFNILCHDFSAGSKSILGYTGEVIYSEENPSSVDFAKKKVLQMTEDTYNCKIGGVLESTRSVTEIVQEQVQSGLQEYDMVFDCVTSLAPLVSSGMLADLTSIPTINLSDPWWDQNSVQDLSIAHKLYFVCGDINTYDNQGTWCMLFNKTLKNKLNIQEDFYELARSGQWNLDKFIEICRSGVTSNTNGDEVLDEFDRWAFGTECYNIYVHVVSAGEKIAEKNPETDLPYLNVAKKPEATFNVLDKVLDFYNDRSTVMVANAPPYINKGYPNVWEATTHKAFIEGRELFYMCGLINVPSFRVMEDEFGILPIPKFSKDQDEYYHTVSVVNMSALALPSNAKEIDDIGLIVSALSERSKEFVTPAYYDIQLKYRDSRDDESGEMLDLIFATRSFDIGASFNWGQILNQYYSMDRSTIASRFERVIDSIQIAMDDTINAILDSNE